MTYWRCSAGPKAANKGRRGGRCAVSTCSQIVTIVVNTRPFFAEPSTLDLLAGDQHIGEQQGSDDAVEHLGVDHERNGLPGADATAVSITILKSEKCRRTVVLGEGWPTPNGGRLRCRRWRLRSTTARRRRPAAEDTIPGELHRPYPVREITSSARGSRHAHVSSPPMAPVTSHASTKADSVA